MYLLKESCVETLEESVLSEKLGAHRLELCSHLDLDGLTPDFILAGKVIEQLHIPVKIMIRPRAGDFVYHEQEMAAMIRDINRMKELKPVGFVLGVLEENKQIDHAKLKILCEAAAPFPVCFHKAIDLCPDPLEAISQIKTIPNLRSVLTSGGSASAAQGAGMIRKMLKFQDAGFKIIVAGGVTASNLEELHQRIGAEEYHGRRIV